MLTLSLPTLQTLTYHANPEFSSHELQLRVNVTRLKNKINETFILAYANYTGNVTLIP